MIRHVQHGHYQWLHVDEGRYANWWCMMGGSYQEFS